MGAKMASQFKKDAVLARSTEEKVNSLTSDNRNYYFNKKENIRGSVATQHYHNSFELYYMKSGKCSYFIHDHSYDVVSGDVILIPAGTIHRTNYGSKPHSRLLINFSEDFVSPEILEEARSLGYLYRNKILSTMIEEIFSLIEAEYARNDRITPHALKTYTEQILLLMIRNTNTKKQEKNGNAIVEQAMRYIQQNYASDIKLSAVAKLMNVSPEHLSRLFKKETSFGFSEYLTLYRLQRAEYILMNEPGRAICDIAYACGFNDSNYFSYRFKEQYGISPSRARGGLNAENLNV
jgi:AraC-like DNA-binding protein/mannose-6-phosphate isomerase-like protein (cupin superfamily)